LIDVDYLAFFSTLKMEAVCSSETSKNFVQTKRRYIPEENTLQIKYNSHHYRRVGKMKVIISNKDCGSATDIPAYFLQSREQQRDSN
jgi:hypothetical protein